MQQLGDRVSAAIVPHDKTSGQVARQAPIKYIDETSWLMHGDRHWLWVMAHPAGAYFQIHPTRSKAACSQRIAGARSQDCL
jgi:transposase